MRTMIIRTILGCVVISGLLATPLAAGEAPPALFVQADAKAQARVSEEYGKLPLHFEANRGQTDPQVRFLSRGTGHTLFLTPTEAVLILTKPEPTATSTRHTHEHATQAVVRLTFFSANPQPQVAGQGELPGKAHYFTGNDPAQWLTNVPTYTKVHYQDLYPGIDLVYYGNQRQLEYDFVIGPGTDPAAIALRVTGADILEVDVHGDLVLHTPAGQIRQQKPLIYQEVDGVRREIAGGYVLQGLDQVGFQVAGYDKSRPLVIDPVLFYSTYLGTGDADQGYGIVVDTAGHAYVTGYTAATNFPTTPGASQVLSGGAHDIYVTKLSPTGAALVYSTYLGGTGRDEGYGIAVDTTGHAYVTGRTRSTNFPTTSGAFQTTFGGDYDAFVAKLSPPGSALVYSTYLGSSGDDQGYGIAVDTTGHAYVTGFTESPDFPTTSGAFQTPYGGNSDAFVAKLHPTGVALVYSTYLGGSSVDRGFGIAVDTTGHAYVTGNAHSTNFPTTPGVFQPTSGGYFDAFVAKLHPTGAALVYSTYLGGNDLDRGFGVAVDTTGHAYVTGDTTSPTFPTTSGAFQTTFGGNYDAFVAKLSPSGSALVYSTYLGGSSFDYGRSIAVDITGHACGTGITGSPNFPTTPGALQPTLGGSEDAYVTTLNPVGTELIYSTYLGGSGQDQGLGVAVDTTGHAYVTGFTYSPNFPTTPGSFHPTFGGGVDAFVAKIMGIVLSPPPTAVIIGPANAQEGASVTLDGSGSRDPEGESLTYCWTQLAGPAVPIPDCPAGSHLTFIAPEVPRGGTTLTFQLVVSDGHQDSEPATVNLTVTNVNHTPVADADAEQRVKEGSFVTLDGSQSYDLDRDPLTYQWVQTGGPSVTLSNPTAAQPSFTAPEVGHAGTQLTFDLIISDGLATARDAVTIVVENVNHAPTADAGAAQTVDEGTMVQLRGTASSDPDTDPLTFNWTQIHGSSVVLSGASTPTPSFTAPLVPSHTQETLVLRLEVSDGLDTGVADVAITVLDVDAPPACELAQATPMVLWPPDHALVAVALGGVSDPDNDQITLTVTGVTQDEPVQGLGDGDTSPDAVPQGDKVLLRAERSGTGNGRVYRVRFTADDGYGGRCAGAVTVCVPHNRRPGTCIDDGQQYEATQP